MNKFIDFISQKWFVAVCFIVLLLSSFSLFFTTFVQNTYGKGVLIFITGGVQMVLYALLAIPKLFEKK